MDRMNTYSAYKPTSTVGDDDTSKYHLYWKIDGLTQDPISGFAQSGELFAFLGLNSLKNSVLKIVSGMSKPSCAIEKLYLNGRLLKEHKNFSYIDCSLQDHMYDNLTVLETLIFSAELRQLTPTHGSELSSIRLLTDMGLEDTSDERVVNLSLWKKRLLLFGTEAVAGRDLLFFDEPTDDLDSNSSLNLVMALQRIARNGRLVAISAGNITFREYAIIDRIQLLTHTGSIYFGAGSAAISYFGHLGRTPFPGASISDFLFDLVDDVRSGFVDVTPLMIAADKQRKIVAAQFEQSKQRLILLDRSNSKPDMDAFHEGGYGNLELGPMGPKEDDYGNGGRYNDLIYEEEHPKTPFGRILLTINWLCNFGCLQTEEEDCPGQPLFVKQILWCCWRALIVRWRNRNQLFGVYAFASALLACGFLTTFVALTNEPLAAATGSGSHVYTNKTVFLTIFPFAAITCSSFWHDESFKDRIILAFERERMYYNPVFMLLGSFIADLMVLRLLPVTITCIILYPALGMRAGFLFFWRFLSVMWLMLVTGCSLVRLCFSAVPALSPEQGNVKALIVALFLLTMQLCYTGLLVDTDNLSWGQFLSIFYWGCNLLYWNELEGLKEKDMPANEMEDVQQIRSDLKLDTFHNDTAYMALLIQMCVYIVLCILSGALLHRTFRK